MTFQDLAALTIHDVKNRLTALAGRAEAAGDRETRATATEAAATLTRLLTLFKTEAGVLRLDIDARAPADLLDDLLALGKDAAVAVRCAEGEAPALGFYDEALVRMVLANALQNALRHARTAVVVGARLAEGNWLEFFVRDDGEGFPPALLAAPDAATPVTGEGTGLGLLLAGRVAALHAHQGRSGRVELSNDGGAVFRLLLPN